MALRNQPYIPLYVQDYLTDEKLNMCSWSTQGIYIKILCILHKQEQYGKVLFKQNGKQNISMTEYFAGVLIKNIPCQYADMLDALNELIEYGVLIIDNDCLIQKRMVKDFNTSQERSKAAKKGGGNPILFKQKNKQIDKQNTEYENEYDNNISNISVKEKTWKTDFEVYKEGLREAFKQVQFDDQFIKQQQMFYPKVDIIKSIYKSITNFWVTEAGWKNKKSKRTKEIDWITTFKNSIDKNKVYCND